MTFRRFLGLPASPSAAGEAATRGSARGADHGSLRRMVDRLETLPAGQARYLAGFAYVLARAAHAEHEITEAERDVIERTVVQFGGLTPTQAEIVAEIAIAEAGEHGATEDFLVTREFRRLATESQRLDLLRCCFLVGAADETISSEEARVLKQIASELDLNRDQLNHVRREFQDRFAVVQAMRRARGA